MSVKLKKCVSPCKGIVLNKCKLPFCNYVNKTRKYCTLNRKGYQLKQDERGCNIYPIKQKATTINRQKTKTNITAVLINKLKQAKERVFTRKVQALRKKHAEKRIKTFMLNPVVREKSTAMFLNSICSDSGVCIAFGQEASKIKKFFNNFTDFTYLHGPIKRIGVVSVNGFIYELAYKRQNYNAYAILKSTAAGDRDNLMYEYFVGTAVNVFSKHFPCFVETYGLFEYASYADWAALKDARPNKEHVLKNNLSLKPAPTFDNLNDGCIKSILQCILIQHLKQTDHLDKWVSIKRGVFINNDLIPILYILYFSLVSLATQFTHYDLHAQNVLLYVPDEDKYIEYVFHERQAGKVPRLVKFKSSFIPKIIDYGHSFYSLNAQDNSDKIYEKLCTINECKPRCGKNYGFGLMNSGDYHIKSRQNNVSHDLRLLAYLRNYIRNPLYKANKPIKDLFNSVVCTGEFGTPEIIASGLPAKINNISDALSSLSDMVMGTEPNLSNTLYSGSKYTSYGELHVYSDGRPMKFIKK
uniref:Uncharacterized protein n=1 Tax=viral metagenome TaxID=1070528 RepID=A0A6C0HGL7_9ZZZZ